MVQVVVRPHPNSARLVVEETVAVVSVDQPSKGSSSSSKATAKTNNKGKGNSGKPRSYQVSMALPPQTTQNQVFESAVLPLLTRWLQQGQHGAMFAYGFTGSGKSWTTFGTEENPGCIVLAAHHLLQQQLNDGLLLRVSIYEVDGKQSKDLLTDEPLMVRVDEHGTVQIRRKDGMGPISKVTLSTVKEFQQIWDKAQSSRRVGSSTIHDASSRTHAVVDLEIVNEEILRLEEAVEEKHARYIEISNNKDDVLRAQIEEAYKSGNVGPTAVVDGVPLTTIMAEYGRPSEEALEELAQARQELVDYTESAATCTPAFLGSFSMIDMAGNDWEQATTVQTKQAKKEHSDINSSLLAVKECFRAMQTKGKKSSHIPYRRSSLTQILKRHFQPTSNCLMLTTIYPRDDEDEVTLKQTMNTLTYASSLVKV